jgi:hypothetical protein
MFQVPFAVMMLVQPDLTWVIAIAGGLAILRGLSDLAFHQDFLRSFSSTIADGEVVIKL